MNGLTLAYLGDSYYELAVRRYLINQGFTQVKILHNKAVKYTSGNAQAKIIDHFIASNFLTEAEVKIYKRGRNGSSSGRKNITAQSYVKSTGFEALIGYLYLEDQTRLTKVIEEAILIVEKGGF